MSVSRSGFVASGAGLILAGAAILTAATISTQSSIRQSEVTARATRLQGREWCLGAATLRPGQQVVCGAWTITRTTAGECLAVHAQGTYRIASDGDEHWRRHGGRP